MGEIHVNIYSTLDGVIEGNGGPEEGSSFQYGGWQGPLFDAETERQVTVDVQQSDALLMGHTTYDIFRRAWPSATGVVGEVFNRVPKYVVSRGTPELSWTATTQLTDVDEVRRLRDRHRQIHTWGSAELVRGLLAERLVDRLNLWVYPVVVGQGKRLFAEGTTPSSFRLLQQPASFPKGAVLIRYAQTEGAPAVSPVPDAGQHVDQLPT